MDQEVENEFQNLIQKKVHLFEMILECAEKQNALDCAEKPAEYKILLERRALYIKDISKTEVIINHFLESKRKMPGNEKLNLLVEQANKKIKNIVQQILTIDETNKVNVTNEMNAVKNKIEMIKKSRKGIIGYASPNQLTPSGVYMDRRK